MEGGRKDGRKRGGENVRMRVTKEDMKGERKEERTGVSKGEGRWDTRGGRKKCIDEGNEERRERK